MLIQEWLLWSLQRTRKLGRIHLVRRDLSACRGTSPTGAFGCHHFAGDAAAMRSLPDGRQDWANSVDDTSSGFWVCEVHSSLDNVIGEGVAKHLLKLSSCQHFIDHLASHLELGGTQALLDHIGAELLLRQSWDIATESLAERLCEMRLRKIQDVLHNVVTKWILDQCESIGRNLSDQTSSLLARGVVNAALQDTASVSMGADNHTIGANCVIDELCVFGRKTVETLLDDMVAIQVLNQLHNMIT